VTYGHFTLAEWERRHGDPYLFENGRWYRIGTTHVIQHLDRVNYQAEEMTDHEIARMKAEMMAGALVSTLPPDEPEQPALVPPGPKPLADSDAAQALPAVEVGPEGVPGVRPPTLTEYARGHGWSGKGRISNEVKANYRRWLQAQAKVSELFYTPKG
jgi:hypothetical protein